MGLFGVTETLNFANEVHQFVRTLRVAFRSLKVKELRPSCAGSGPDPCKERYPSPQFPYPRFGR